jgi:hypothetical protein
MRRVARDEAACSLVAAERDELRIQLRCEADGMAAPAPVLRIGDRMLLQRARHGGHRRRLHERHVGRKQQPPWSIRPRTDTGGDGVAHSQSDSRAGVWQHDDVARRHEVARLCLQRLGRHHEHRQMARDRADQRAREQRQPLQRLLELVPVGRKPASASGGEDDQQGSGSHDSSPSPPRMGARSHVR